MEGRVKMWLWCFIPLQPQNTTQALFLSLKRGVKKKKKKIERLLGEEHGACGLLVSCCGCLLCNPRELRSPSLAPQQESLRSQPLKRGQRNFSIVMMNVLSGHHQNVNLQVRDTSLALRGRSCRVQYPYALDGAGTLADPRRRLRPFVAVRAVSGSGESSSGEDDDQDKPSKKEEGSSGSGGLSREDLERLVGTDDDAKFSGLDLANLIRKKYGRSYDVTLIKKEFMGRNLLAMNVMWKYREQRSFPLSEEEYLLRLDDVANTLKCWGAVAHVRNTLEKLKERPRIGKAVSIFIDMDQTGERSNEWIYK